MLQTRSGKGISTENVMSLPDRLAASPANLPYHGHADKPHVYTIQEGNEMNLLFTVLLEDFRTSGIIDRVQPGYGGAIPKACSDPQKFHGTYAKDFKKIYDGKFEDLGAHDQRRAVMAFLQMKFSTDRLGECMVPEDAKRRKTLSWKGFYITDEELPRICQRVMAAYDATRAAAGSSATAASSAKSTGWLDRLT